MKLGAAIAFLFFLLHAFAEREMAQRRNPLPRSRAQAINCFHKEGKEQNLFCPAVEEKRETKTQTSTQQATSGNSANKTGCTSLMRASENGDIQTVRALLRDGSDLNAELAAHTALTLAAKEGHLEIVRALLSAGADPNVRGITFHFGEYWALMSAMDRCNKDWLEIIDAMIAAGAELSPKAGYSRSPFMYAVEHDVVMTKALIARGADINSKNVDSDTPLMVAVLGSDPRMVRFLLAAGADVNARNLKGETALAIVRRLKRDFPNSEQDEIIRLLKNAMRSGSKRNTKRR